MQHEGERNQYLIIGHTDLGKETLEATKKAIENAIVDQKIEAIVISIDSNGKQLEDEKEVSEYLSGLDQDKMQLQLNGEKIKGMTRIVPVEPLTMARYEDHSRKEESFRKKQDRLRSRHHGRR